MKSEYNKGFIKIWRNIALWDWWSDINTSRLWLVILLNANWQDNTWQGIDIKRGSLLTSIGELSEMSQLTIQQTRTALKHLVKTSNITIKSTNRYSLITIVNYDFWQGEQENLTSKSTSTLANNLTSKPTSKSTTNKEGKTIKNDKNDKNNPVVDSSDLMELLTIDELKRLLDTYEDANTLIDLVQDQIDSSSIHIKHSAYKYICSYAANKNWPYKRNIGGIRNDL